ncbi:MAG: phosphotransferase family protein [Rhodospirillales bacterium]|nr:phosphotransferase family protein [Rhodospirillales bacterium]
MERIAGAIPADRPPYRIGGWVSEASARARECMWRSAIQRLVEVHRADWHSLGLEPLFRGGGKGKSELDAQIDYLAAYNVWANDGNKTPLVARAEAWLRARKPKQERLRLCWGDARPANMVFDAELCVGLLDWELVTIGDPVQDLAWWTFSERMFDSLIGTANLQGCLSGDALLDAYAEISGEPMLNFDYYDVYNMFRCVAIITRQTRVRDRLGQPPTPGFTSTDNFALRRLAQRLEQLN